MPALQTPPFEMGQKAVDFDLRATDGARYRLGDVAGARGTLIMFICNHCPYVRAVVHRLVADCRLLLQEGVGAAAIMSNDTQRYPDDHFDHMVRFAAEHSFPFPYLIDETQDVARAYGAVCTPDFFGFDAAGELRYRGRLDAGRLEPPPPGAPREMVEAMRSIAATGQGPEEQLPSIGCSIKWFETV